MARKRKAVKTSPPEESYSDAPSPSGASREGDGEATLEGTRKRIRPRISLGGRSIHRTTKDDVKSESDNDGGSDDEYQDDEEYEDDQKPKHAEVLPPPKRRGRPRKHPIADDASPSAGTASPSQSLHRHRSSSNAMEVDDSGIQTQEDEEDQGPSRGRRTIRVKSYATPMSPDETSQQVKRSRRLPEDLDAGWLEELDDKSEAQAVYTTVVQRIRSWLAEHGDRTLTAYMEAGTSTSPGTGAGLDAISQRIASGTYTTAIEFEKDMMQLFSSGRKHLEAGSDEYGGLVTLQRMYQHITQSAHDVAAEFDADLLSRNFASVRYGPCEEVEPQVYGESPSTGVKFATNKIRYKGQEITIGNWVHLSNPTDPARPIVGQVFRTRSEDLGDHNQDWITVCWFLRPEQTRHPRSMQFWDNEVVKTSILVEHHVEDILEMVYVMFYTRYSRGRPPNGDMGWYEGDPLYACETRYQFDKNAYYKIKNWASCMPEEYKMRKNDIVEFDQPILMREKDLSPFLRGVRGPGELVSETYMQTSGGGVRDVRPVRETSAQPVVSASDGRIPQLFKEWSKELRAQRKAYLKLKAERRAKGLPPLPEFQAHVSQLPPTPDVPKQDAPAQDNQQQPFPSQGPPEPPQHHLPVVAPPVDRTLNTAMLQADVSGYFKALPDATHRLFQQDPETGHVLWYPAPPLHNASAHDLQRRWNQGQPFQAHSLDYLYSLATRDRTNGADNARMHPANPLDEWRRCSPYRMAPKHPWVALDLDDKQHTDATQGMCGLERRMF